jgi:phage gp16-like protein
MSMRTSLLATVHVAKKELQLDDTTYRQVLARVVKKSSSGDCTDAQLRLLIAEFERLGWKKKPGKKAAKRPLSARSEVRMIYAIWGDIKPLLDGEAHDTQLRSFVRRQTGKDAAEFCSHGELVRVIEGLKGWRARLQAKQVAA